MPIVVINDTNHTGLIADITFTASTGPISSLGSHQIPYSFDTGSNDYFGTYELYYPQYNQTCQFNYPPALTFVVDTTTCSTFTFTIGSNSIFNMSIDWGDGTPIENFYGLSAYIGVQHDYSPLQNIFTITVSIDNTSIISTLDAGYYGCGNITEIKNLNLLTTLKYCYLQNNQLSSNSINNLLIGLSGNGQSNGTVLLNNQTPPACPTGLGLDAQNYLINTLGWIVQTDYFCEPLLEFVVDTNYSQLITFATYDLTFLNAFNLTIDWGDGTPPDSTTYVGDTYYDPGYTYSTYGIYTVKVGVSKKNVVTLLQNTSYQNLIGVNNINIFPNLTEVQFQGQRLSSSTINDILISLSGNGVSSGNLYLNSQTPPACPTGLGLQAYNHLVNNLGWFVDVYFCPFTSIWRTTSPNETIYLPIYNGGNYYFNINWGDGNSETITSYTTNSHTYVSAGDYTVTITGLIDGWNFSQVITSRENIIEITSWGSLSLGNDCCYFTNCSNLTLSNVSDILDLSMTTNLSDLFVNCGSLTTVNNINSWDVSNITDMTNMFNGSQFNQDIGNWDVRNVNSMSVMFFNSQFNQDISNWQVSGVTDMSFMFWGTPFNQDIGNWNVSNVQDFSNMFKNSLFNNGGSSSISNWTPSAAISMDSMFNNSQFNQDIGNWNVSSVFLMSRMFKESPFDNAGIPSISGWITSSVVSMSEMFENSPFNQPIGSWDVGNVQDLSRMFFSVTGFNQNIGTWNVGNVLNFTEMFRNATSFNNGGSASISGWTTSAATNMNSIFYMDTTSGSFNQNIGNWDVSNVIDMYGMFTRTPFNNGGSPSISGWTTSASTNMNSMFYDTQFNQNIGNWDVSNVQNMSGMFGLSPFNNGGSPSISGWTTSAVTDMNSMFYFAQSFNQDLSNWCVQQIPSTPTNFAFGASLWTLPKPNWGAVC